MRNTKNVLSLVFFAFLILSLLSLNFCYADTQMSKLGNAFSSTTGNYAASSHCVAGQTCSWISGSEVLVGIYDSNFPNWQGSVTWNFDLSGVNLNSIDRAEIKVSWPSSAGKGLHSPYNTGQGIIRVNGNEIARRTTNYTRLGAGDYFAHDPYIYYLNFPFLGNLLSASTSITLETTTATGWNIGEVKLYLYESNKTVRIVNGKFLFRGSEWMIKGMDYAPWIDGTGPEPDHQPFPNENDDVTVQLTNAGRVTVTDYNSDVQCCINNSRKSSLI